LYNQVTELMSYIHRLEAELSAQYTSQHMPLLITGKPITRLPGSNWNFRKANNL